MPLKADDLEVGDLVVVSEMIDDTPLSWEMMYKRRRENQELNGKPWKIAAVSLPFVIIKDSDGVIDTIDYRIYKLTRISKEYVRAYENSRGLYGEHRRRSEDSRTILTGSLKKKKGKPDPKRCPRCHDRMRERLQTGGVWRLVCPTCGWNGPEKPPEIEK